MEAADEAVHQFNSLPLEAKTIAAERIREGNPGLFPLGEFPKGDKSLVRLWGFLLFGVFVVALACIVGAIIFGLNGKDAGPFFVIIAAVVSGSIGLFSKSPASAGK